MEVRQLRFSRGRDFASSPERASPFAIGAGKTAGFTFSSSGPGAYSTYFGLTANAAPTKFPTDHSQVLRLYVDTSVHMPFPGTDATMGTAH
jgi:hypothetical protein